ncbi:hypothetical protein JCM14469_33300 [Desulfatiferula olefinivorans]
MPTHPEKIKFAFYVLIVLILLVVVIIFVNYRLQTGRFALFSPSDPGATLTLDRVDHTASKAGVRQWSLKAETVNYYQDRNEALFHALTLVFFAEDGTVTTLTSDQGIMETTTRDITATGHVVIVNGPYTLKTETLHYAEKKRLITTPVPATVTKDRSRITGDRLILDMNTGITRLEGNVKGVFIETD